MNNLILQTLDVHGFQWTATICGNYKITNKNPPEQLARRQKLSSASHQRVVFRISALTYCMLVEMYMLCGKGRLG